MMSSLSRMLKRCLMFLILIFLPPIEIGGYKMFDVQSLHALFFGAVNLDHAGNRSNHDFFKTTVQTTAIANAIAAGTPSNKTT